MRWRTVPVCEACWRAQERGPTTPPRIRPELAELETCYACLRSTQSGLYVRREVLAP